MAPPMELGVSDAAGQHVASRRKAEMSEQFLLLDSGGGGRRGEHCHLPRIGPAMRGTGIKSSRLSRRRAVARSVLSQSAVFFLLDLWYS